jgi:hypothetical protein
MLPFSFVHPPSKIQTKSAPKRNYHFQEAYSQQQDFSAGFGGMAAPPAPGGRFCGSAHKFIVFAANFEENNSGIMELFQAGRRI